MAGDLSVTALYTSHVWAWGRLSYAHLFATPDGKRVFDVTNAALAVTRRPPLRYALLHRHAMIDHLLSASQARRVVEIAAGLSRRGAAFCRDRTYTEIDLPPVIAKKRALLERTAEGREILATLTLIGEDVEHAILPAADLVIAEGLLMYLDGAARRALFAKVRASAREFIFDLVPASDEPAPGRVGRVLERAMKRFTGGRGFERDAQTRAQILGELRDAGFDDARATASAEIAREWALPYPERVKARPMIVFSAQATRA